MKMLLAAAALTLISGAAHAEPLCNKDICLDMDAARVRGMIVDVPGWQKAYNGYLFIVKIDCANGVFATAAFDGVSPTQSFLYSSAPSYVCQLLFGKNM